ncbi:NRDE family protein [Pseudomonas sp.]|uniref:NRDE family protein n=1 Tax=Pseudomonas sp. TaxID=306 RepID=UPI003563ADFD
MCLLALSWHNHAQYSLVVAANRDEFYRRPSRAADFWPNAPGVLAGRDEEQGGSWLGLHVDGRFAALTNARGASSVPGAPSRGALVSDFLTSQLSARAYAETRLQEIAEYAGCNLFVCDSQSLHYLTNHPTPEARELPPGSYALSNGHLDDAWPKMRNLGTRFEQLLLEPIIRSDDLLGILTCRTLANDDDLPDTGVDPSLEKQLSSIFIHLPTYGTRCSTVITVDSNGHTRFTERRFNSEGEAAGDSEYELTCRI